MLVVRALTLGIFVLLLGCSQSALRPHALQAPIALPRHVLIAPPDIMIRFRASANTPTLPDPDSSALSQSWTTNFLLERWSENTEATLLSQAALREPEVQEQIGLYYQVAAQAFDIMASREIRWRHKREFPDFSIGPGLAELGSVHNAQAIVFVVGQQTQASLAMKWLNSDSIVPAALTAGIVEMSSGRILWLSHIEPASGQRFDEQADLELMLTELFSSLRAPS